MGMRARSGFTLIELLVVVVIIGILATVATPSFVAAQDRARNAKAAANLNVVRVALENYGSDNKGIFPANADFAGAAGLGQQLYLPGNRLPLSPWSKVPQTARIEPTVDPLLYAEDLTAGFVKPAPGKPYAPATTGAVGNPPSTVFHYGAITSDCDDVGDRTAWVVCAVGKKNGNCVLAGYLSNTGQ